MHSQKISVLEINRFMVQCMSMVGTPQPHAMALANLLLAADRRGHYSHGINRLEMYVRDVQNKMCDPSATPSILKETASTAWVSGNNGLGPVVGNYCMDLAIKKAYDSGVGWVAAKCSNHYGMAAWYSMQALKHNMLGISVTNSSPLMCPTRGKTAVLGTNPISCAAPGLNDDNFVLDMATTAVSLGKIEVAKRKGAIIPEGWALGPDGHVTTDPEIAYQTQGLMPLGGPEEKSGYKGYGLSLMVETLSGIMADSAYGSHVRKWTDGSKVANIGHCFIALNVKCFAPDFEKRMSDMTQSLRMLPPVGDSKPVLVPGDPEKSQELAVEEEKGIYYHENQIKQLEEFARELGVKPMDVVQEK